MPANTRVDVPPVGRSLEECRDLFLAEQDTIKAVIARIARRYRLNPDQTEDLASEISLKLLDNDCLILRKFEGRSSLRTYLIVVINRLFLDSQIARYGKWRPSAIARQSGRVAMMFEQLTTRDGFSFDQACMLLEIAYGPIDRDALDALAGRLPARVQWRPIWLEEMPDIPGGGDPVSWYEANRRAEHAARSQRVLMNELFVLSPEDRVIVRRRFLEGATVATVARELSLDPKALYRHIARLLKTLRQRLEARGVTYLDARELPL